MQRKKRQRQPRLHYQLHHFGLGRSAEESTFATNCIPAQIKGLQSTGFLDRVFNSAKSGAGDRKKAAKRVDIEWHECEEHLHYLAIIRYSNKRCLMLMFYCTDFYNLFIWIIHLE